MEDVLAGMQVLAWITQQKEKGSVDEIEDVDRPMLEMLLDQMEAVTVVFCKNLSEKKIGEVHGCPFTWGRCSCPTICFINELFPLSRFGRLQNL